jgi:hypothetical protein
MTDDARVEEVRSSLPATQWAVASLTSHDWQHVAAFLTGLLLRRPLSTGENEISGWAAERLILGCLASELRLLAHEAGEPEMVPRTFGRDPLERARALVAEMASIQEEREAEVERRRGDGEARLGRLQEHWDAATPSGSSS